VLVYYKAPTLSIENYRTLKSNYSQIVSVKSASLTRKVAKTIQIHLKAKPAFFQ
jgi:hypothetical protein